jgi:curved DNA-binding protein CbpA
MPVKDYYKILGVEPGATEQEIKKGFRHLAKRFHPDTNQGNKYSEAWFRELQEAYDTLTDPAKKEAYLQERWLAKSQGRSMARPVPLTPETIVMEVRELATQVAQIDHFRMDHEKLAANLLELLNEERMDVLMAYNETTANRQVTSLLLNASSPVVYPLQAPLYKRLFVLCRNDEAYANLIKNEQQKRHREYWWSRHQWWVMLLATLLLCGAVYLSGKQ